VRSEPGGEAVGGERPVAPGFLVVGSARSGTTLVQRLAWSLDGVRVPAETHFFSDFATDLARGWSFPLAGRDLADALAAYARRPYLRGVAFEPGRLADALGGACQGPLELFGAVVAELAGTGTEAGDVLTGEKTPAHLLWWEPLSRRLPALRVVAVVRDPRAVAASHQALDWGRDPVAVARRWVDDLGRLSALWAALGPARSLVLRYEDVVAHPRGAVAAMGRLLGRRPAPAGSAATGTPAGLAPTGTPAGSAATGTAAGLAPSGTAPAGSAATGTAAGLAPTGTAPAWETWKQRAEGPPDTTRVDAWRHELDERVVALVEAWCGPAMVAAGYAPVTVGTRRCRRLAGASPRQHWSALRHQAHRWRREAEIARLGGGWLEGGPGAGTGGPGVTAAGSGRG